MTRGQWNFLVDFCAGVLLTAAVGTGYILWFVLPPGTNRTHELWGLQRHEFGALHAGLAIAILGLLTIHMALHWSWFVRTLSTRLGFEPWAQRRPRLAKLVVAAAAGIPLVALAVAAHGSVRPLGEPLHKLGGGETNGGHQEEEPDASRARAAALLASRCASCHGARQPAGDVRADTPEALLADQNDVRWVRRGRPNASPLFAAIGPSSPVEHHSLSEDEVRILRAWIASSPP